MKHLMTRSTKVIDLDYWIDYEAGTLFRFANDLTVWRVVIGIDGDLAHIQQDGDGIYDNDTNISIVLVEFVRVTKAGNSIYRDVE